MTFLVHFESEKLPVHSFLTFFSALMQRPYSGAAAEALATDREAHRGHCQQAERDRFEAVHQRSFLVSLSNCGSWGSRVSSGGSSPGRALRLDVASSVHGPGGASPGGEAPLWGWLILRPSAVLLFRYGSSPLATPSVIDAVFRRVVSAALEDDEPGLRCEFATFWVFDFERNVQCLVDVRFVFGATAACCSGDLRDVPAEVHQLGVGEVQVREFFVGTEVARPPRRPMWSG